MAERKSLKQRAVSLLARREYSRAELRAKLLGGADRQGRIHDEGGVRPDDDRESSAGEDLDAVLDELARLGYLSDARYAKALVQQKSGTRSRRSINAALKASGVAEEVAAEALAEHAIDDGEAMIALWRKRFGTPPADDKEKARQVRFLQARGFSLSAILKLLRDPPSDRPPD